jgi:hypothetical protein
MSSLYKRATPLQRRMLRIVAGAVINAHHAHAIHDISIERFARSVAKRAVGTLSAQMLEVLAGSTTPVTEGGATVRSCPTDGGVEPATALP